MANLMISEKLLQQLRSVAEREQRTVDELAEEALASYVQATTPEAGEAGEEQSEPGSFAALAQSAIEANLYSPKRVNTAERSREILETEYADYIVNRMRQGRDDETNPD